MIKYEYKIEGFDYRNAETELNKLGKEGWEAVGFSESSAVIRVVLKRAVLSDGPFMAGGV